MRAEVADRPLAYQLSDHIEQWRLRHASTMNVELGSLVISDIWFLNNTALHQQPTISIGGPTVNALTAAWQSSLPFVLLREDELAIQLDPHYVELRGSIWGMNHSLTADALSLFKNTYCDRFLRAVATQIEPAT